MSGLQSPLNRAYHDENPLTIDVTVRVGDERITRRLVNTTVLDPMGEVRHAVANERGIDISEVWPVGESVVTDTSQLSESLEGQLKETANEIWSIHCPWEERPAIAVRDRQIHIVAREGMWDVCESVEEAERSLRAIATYFKVAKTV